MLYVPYYNPGLVSVQLSLKTLMFLAQILDTCEIFTIVFRACQQLLLSVENDFMVL